MTFCSVHLHFAHSNLNGEASKGIQQSSLAGPLGCAKYAIRRPFSCQYKNEIVKNIFGSKMQIRKYKKQEARNWLSLASTYFYSELTLKFGDYESKYKKSFS